jgi:hypothetical protein
MFFPYEYKTGFMKKQLDKDLLEVQNSLQFVLQKFIEVKDAEPSKRFIIK